MPRSEALEITAAAPDKACRPPVGRQPARRIILARWLLNDVDILILDEPTQGIDVGARLAIYRLINRLTAAGKWSS